MQPGDISALRSAVDDLNDGNIDAFVGLLSDDMVWSGHPHGWLWWRRRPH